MSEFTSTKLDVPTLVKAGCGILELRKLGISPADIRLAGFTFVQMSVHLGVDRLKEAGFSLKEFQSHGTPLSQLATKFPIQDIVRSNKYTLTELLNYLPPAELRQHGHFTAKDFVSQLGCNSVTVLKQYGFLDAEIAESGLSIAEPAVPISSLPYQPPHAKQMRVGESWSTKRTGDASTFLEVCYNRVDEEAASVLLRSAHVDNVQSSSYRYDGSGKYCPRCGRLFILVDKYTSSDGMCGVERGTWICDDANCGMKKTERYEGYGSIF